jgi:hypothetical protein
MMQSTPFSVFRYKNKPIRLICGILLTAGICSSGGGAAAATNSQDALGHGRIGLEEFNAGRWQSALDEFSRADSLMHSPVFRLYAARCKRQLGQWLEAREQYLRLTEMPITASDPLPWQKAAADARLELTALNAEFPAVRITVTGSSLADPKPAITLDGLPIEASRWGDLFELSPGEHVAVLLNRDEPVLARKFTLLPGDRAQVIELQIPLKSEPPDMPRVAVAAPPSARAPNWPRVEPPSPPVQHPHRIAGTVALSAGALSVAAGAVCGVWAWRERNDLIDRCGGYQCPPEEQPRWQRANLAANIATASLIFGGLNLALGGYLFYFTPSAGSTRNSNRAISRELSLGLVRSF